jgi:CDP-6-deoxy-D-xylo-4-hexulose-3-dehydrase
MGEGGGVVVNHPRLKKTACSIRDWGRDCWCDPGKSNTCGRRFDWTLGDLPHGYDHKYIYSNLGYNLKVTDLQAAIGLAQFEKIPEFVAARRRNFHLLEDGDLKVLILPKVHPKANPSPFGFPVTVRPALTGGTDRPSGSASIETRRSSAATSCASPAFAVSSVHGTMDGADTIMNRTLFVVFSRASHRRRSST